MLLFCGEKFLRINIPSVIPEKLSQSLATLPILGTLDSNIYVVITEQSAIVAKLFHCKMKGIVPKQSLATKLSDKAGPVKSTELYVHFAACESS